MIFCSPETHKHSRKKIRIIGHILFSKTLKGEGGKLCLRPEAGAASVCLLSMTFLLGASRLGLFVFLRLEDAFGGIEISFLLGAPL